MYWTDPTIPSKRWLVSLPCGGRTLFSYSTHTHTHIYIYIHIYMFFFLSPLPPMPPHVLCGLCGPPSSAWQECNWLLRLGRPWATVTLSWWCVSGDRGGCSARGALNLNFTTLPRPWSPRESSPSRKIPTVELGIEPRTSWLVVRNSDH